ncbi:hypothetical protein CASFOL_030778 [Castilleja foliolosa]|uniref:Ribosomal protein L18a n=1 Tax=Castilleja foliolosa TaxID=1961234 RepID=A0ABD3C7B8_9LAMI
MQSGLFNIILSGNGMIRPRIIRGLISMEREYVTKWLTIEMSDVRMSELMYSEEIVEGVARISENHGGVRMDQNATVEEGEGRNALELVKSVSDKHLDLLRPSARYYSMFKGQATDNSDREKGRYTLIKDEDNSQLGIYDKPMPCFGCGIGWFSFLLGFFCPLLWYYATILYFGNYYRKDPRERAGLAASAIAAMGCSVIMLIVILVLLF